MARATGERIKGDGSLPVWFGLLLRRGGEVVKAGCPNWGSAKASKRRECGGKQKGEIENDGTIF